MHSDEAFLRAIRDNAADDAPWLIYADWLDEQGDPRAALYRNRRRTNTVGMRLVLVPRGTFWMGERGHQRQVEVRHDFYIGAFPVTQGQWQVVMGCNPSWFSRGGGGADKVKGVLRRRPETVPRRTGVVGGRAGVPQAPQRPRER